MWKELTARPGHVVSASWLCHIVIMQHYWTKTRLDFLSREDNITLDKARQKHIIVFIPGAYHIRYWCTQWCQTSTANMFIPMIEIEFQVTVLKWYVINTKLKICSMLLHLVENMISHTEFISKTSKLFKALPEFFLKFGLNSISARNSIRWWYKLIIWWGNSQR